METPATRMSPRAIVGWLFVLIVAGLAIGALQFGPYFIYEHQRLPFWEGTLVWLGDATALFWFGIFCVRHFLLSVPIEDPPRVLPGRARFVCWLALLSILASLGADLWFTLSLRGSERQAFATSERAQGSIERLTRFDFGPGKRVVYTLYCSYKDANQVVHSAVFQLRDPDELPNLPPFVGQAVRAERLPVPVAIAYDASWPKRSWLADLGWQDMTRIHGFSLCVLLFQAIGSLVFLLAFVAGIIVRDLPWWHDLHGVVLVALEAVFLLIVGGFGLLFGIPFFWGEL